jgi:hypothetical protein
MACCNAKSSTAASCIYSSGCIAISSTLSTITSATCATGSSRYATAAAAAASKSYRRTSY